MITLDHIELTRFFLSIVLLLFSALFFGSLFQKFKLPKVIGEIFGGFILGYGVLGYLMPDVFNWIFNAYHYQGKLISILSWFGLIFLMFISGFEIERAYSSDDKKTVLALLIGATIIPFIAGWVIPEYYDFTPFIGVKNNIFALKIIIALAVAVTSIPVISKIFIDLNIIHTRFAKIVIGTATIQDIVLWIAVSIATGIVINENINSINIVYTVIITLIFFLISLFLMPGILEFSLKTRFNLLIKSSIYGYGLFICFLFVVIASVLNVNIVFGALLAGVIIGKLPAEKFSSFKKSIKDISLGFFVPVYFAVVGLKLDVINHFNFNFFLFFLIFSSLFEIVGTFTAAKLNKKKFLSSLNFAIAMNTRGGPGIVLATIAYDLGIINQTFFGVLVLIAIITSLISGFWFKFVLNKGWSLLETEILYHN